MIKIFCDKCGKYIGNEPIYYVNWRFEILDKAKGSTYKEASHRSVYCEKCSNEVKDILEMRYKEGEE